MSSSGDSRNSGESLRKKTGILLFAVSAVFILTGSVLLIPVYAPVVQEEVQYRFFTEPNPRPVLTPVSAEFSIQIPKIRANAPVIKDVDPFNESEYQAQLARGVAHAKGTSLPGQRGTMFLFAHSASDFALASRYNAVFYLLSRLQPGDDILITFKGKQLKYTVQELRYVDESQIEYISESTGEHRLILMTCWPPGTTLKRLLVVAS
ncbi:MAG: sortase [Patescibacteria group bacterium]|nr:sortase [Patescibacteria group bacterium]